MTFWQFLQAYYGRILIVAWFLVTGAVNALPAPGDPFVFGTWFMATLREWVNQAPAKFPILTAAEKREVMAMRARETDSVDAK
jgi:hypothetical protein